MGAGKHPALAPRHDDGLVRCASVRSLEVCLCHVVRQGPCVDVDEARHALRDAVCRTGRHEGAVAVADEHDVVQVLLLEQADDVVDVGGQVGLG